MQTGEHGQSLCDTLQIKTPELQGSDAMMTDYFQIRSYTLSLVLILKRFYRGGG